MDIIIGNKTKIAVEIKSAHLNESKSPVGYARLWLGDNFFGTIFDYIYLNGYLLGGLEKIGRAPFLDNLGSSKNCNEAFNFLYKRLSDDNDENIHNYLINFGTLTDMFTIFAFRNENNISIVWQIRTDDGYNYEHFDDLKNYPKSSFCHTLSHNEFKRFVEEVENAVLNI